MSEKHTRENKEPIEVTARFDEDGKVTPLELRWKGSQPRVESTGRSWKDEAGLHILVQVVSGRMYELIFRSGEGKWYISQPAPDRSFV